MASLEAASEQPNFLVALRIIRPKDSVLIFDTYKKVSNKYKRIFYSGFEKDIRERIITHPVDTDFIYTRDTIDAEHFMVFEYATQDEAVASLDNYNKKNTKAYFDSGLTWFENKKAKLRFI